MRIVVFDVGGTFIKYALSDENGHFSNQGKKQTPKESHEEFLQVIQDILDEFKDVDGMAFSLPGFINPDTGYISVGGSLRYHDDYSFVEKMSEHFHLPVSVQNDAKCAALAEVWKGDAKNHKNSVVVVFGTGVGGALIQDGNVYLGSHFMCSELSCVIRRDLNKYGFDATLGNCLSIPKLMQKISNVKGTRLNGEKVFELYKMKDQQVCEIIDSYFMAAAIEIFNFQCFYDPEIFYIGGGISEEPIFVQGLQCAVNKFLERIPFKIPHIRIESTTMKADANLMGALYHYLKQQGN